ncbi:MAG: chromosome segregation protein SMC, partial [Chitinophagaceae bacterium]
PNNTLKALNVIEVDAAYNQLAQYLLANVFIAENDEAFTQANAGIVLEKSGKLVKGKYTLTGGSVGLFEGKKIGRAKNLEKLNDEIVLLDAVVQTLKANIQTMHNRVIGFNEQLKENAIKQTENEINVLTNQVFAVKNKIENTQAAKVAAVQRLEDLQVRLEDEQEAIATTRETLADLNANLLKIAEELKLVEQDYKFAEADYQQASSLFNENNLLFTKQQSKINTLQQELTFKQNQLNDLHEQINNNSLQLTDAALLIQDGEKAVIESEDALLSLMRTKEEEEKKLNEADQAFYNLRNELQAKETELKQKIKSKELLDASLNAIKDKLNELKLQLAGMKERLHVEFKIVLDEVLTEARTTETSLEELQATSDRMRKRMDNMGEVNPTAIEAYTEMKKRYDF